MLQILRGNPVILTLTLMLNTLRSILRFSATFQKHCNPLVYQILARMYSFFEKLKPTITDIMISDCSLTVKCKFYFFGSKRPFVPRRGVQASKFQALRRPESKRIHYARRVQLFQQAHQESFKILNFKDPNIKLPLQIPQISFDTSAKNAISSFFN